MRTSDCDTAMPDDRWQKATDGLDVTAAYSRAQLTLPYFATYEWALPEWARTLSFHPFASLQY